MHAAALPALRRLEVVRAPFDSTALANAIERVVQEVTRRMTGVDLEKSACEMTPFTISGENGFVIRKAGSAARQSRAVPERQL